MLWKSSLLASLWTSKIWFASGTDIRAWIVYVTELVPFLADLDERAELLINLLPFTLVGAFVGVLVELCGSLVGSLVGLLLGALVGALVGSLVAGAPSSAMVSPRFVVASA